MQIIYCVCAGGGFFVYVQYGFPHVPNKYLAYYHKYAGSLIVLMCYYSFYKACSTDPGYFDKNTKKAKVKEYAKIFDCDGIVYGEKVPCRTCKIEKPARSKHCVMCDKCVLKFDHHCIWINQCVGLYNYKWFLTFLLLHGVITTYGSIAGIAILLQIIDDQDLFRGSFVN